MVASNVIGELLADETSVTLIRRNLLSQKVVLFVLIAQPLMFYNALNPNMLVQGLFSGFVHPQAVLWILFGGYDFAVPGLALAELASSLSLFYVLWTRTKRVSSDQLIIEAIASIFFMVYLHVTATVLWIRLEHGFITFSWWR